MQNTDTLVRGDKINLLKKNYNNHSYDFLKMII